MPRLWNVCHKHNYVTTSDFVEGRYGSHWLALAVAFTGVLATMPYIALQLLGIKVVLGAMGISGDWPLIIAFAILAAYTYQSGLRAPALISIVKDLLIYVTVIVAVIYIPSKLGGYGAIFDAAGKALPQKQPKPGALIPGTGDAQWAYATLALGSAMALFLYPHAMTGALSSKSANTVRRNAAILPAYSLLLGLMALLGFMTIAAAIKPASPNDAVPDLFLKFFPPWFEGVAFAAIAIGALVPAAVMSIAAANLFTRNVWREFVDPNVSPQRESQIAKLASLFVKVGALIFVIALPTEYAIDLQLLGGVWILQTLPSVALGLYTRWLDARAMLLGWVGGMAVGTYMAIDLDFKGSVYKVFGINAYSALWALATNLVIAVVVTAILRAIGAGDSADETAPDDYAEREPTEGAEALPATPEQEPRFRHEPAPTPRR
jgi:SSS family solute:Na+ symporter